MQTFKEQKEKFVSSLKKKFDNYIKNVAYHSDKTHGFWNIGPVISFLYHLQDRLQSSHTFYCPKLSVIRAV
jgi:hypothetical protein